MGKCIYSTLNNFLLLLYTGKRKKNNKEAAVDVPLVEDLWPRKPLIPTTLILPSAQIPQLIDAHDDDGHHGPGDRRDDLANMELWMVCTSGAQVVHMHKLVETNAQDFSSQVACLLSIHLLCAGQD